MSLVANERIKLSAAYLNTAAGGLFTAGVVAPLAATVFGVSGPSSLSALTLSGGIAIFLLASIALHGCAHHSGKAAIMTDLQIVAFVVAPLMAVAVGCGVTLWSRYADR